ncbi:10702_t:CDS:2, partial [Racocetra persica]
QPNMNQQETRKNTANACDECVKSKRKCESSFPQICKRCTDKNLACTYSHYKKKRGPKPNKVTEKNIILSIFKPENFEFIEVGDKKYAQVELTQDTTSNDTTSNIRPHSHFPDLYYQINNRVPDAHAHNSFQNNYPAESGSNTYDYQSPLQPHFPDTLDYCVIFPTPPNQWV